ncbi:MAG TPA: hypothetical protein VN634_06380 [Candidatus Limnocylindrales bacterium]|nr:hypothetical protein [Candidatus Limnocylindrales bacterium]
MHHLARRALALALPVVAAPAAAFVTFESGPVRPRAMSPDGNRLFVCNIPDNPLEIFDITAEGLTLAAGLADETTVTTTVTVIVGDECFEGSATKVDE